MDSLVAERGLDIVVLGIFGGYVAAEALVLWIALAHRMHLGAVLAWSIALTNLMLLLVALAVRIPFLTTVLMMMTATLAEVVLTLNIKRRTNGD